MAGKKASVLAVPAPGRGFPAEKPGKLTDGQRHTFVPRQFWTSVCLDSSGKENIAKTKMEFATITPKPNRPRATLLPPPTRRWALVLIANGSETFRSNVMGKRRLPSVFALAVVTGAVVTGLLSAYASAATPEALSDCNQTKHISDLYPKDSMLAIWLHIAERRTGRDKQLASKQLASKTANFNMTRWPAPVVRLFIGEGTLPFELSSNELASGLQCEADFYSAEFMLWQGQKADAVRLYKSAQQKCVRIWLEWGAAFAALRSLGEKQ